MSAVTPPRPRTRPGPRLRPSTERPGAATRDAVRGRRRPGAPVFVDRSGTRRRLAAVIGYGVGGALVVGLALMFAGLFGTSPLTLPNLPGHQRPGAVVTTRPSARDSSSPASTPPAPPPAPGAADTTPATPTATPTKSPTTAPTPTASPTAGNTHRGGNTPNPHSSKSR